MFPGESRKKGRHQEQVVCRCGGITRARGGPGVWGVWLRVRVEMGSARGWGWGRQGC